MNKIQGIYAASLTVFNQDLSLNVKKTISHAAVSYTHLRAHET